MPDGHPWRSDRHLDIALVEELVSAQFPQLADLPVQFLDEGWDFHVYEIGGTWILRFPKREEVLPWLAREQRILDRIGDRLPLAVPSYSLFGEPDHRFPYPFAGYRKLEGETALLLEPAIEDIPAMAGQFGELLSELHGIAGEELRGLQLHDDFKRDWPQQRLAKLAAQLKEYRPLLGDSLYLRLVDFMKREPHPEVPRAARACLAHDDLVPVHILVNREASRLVGVIDWSDASTGDAAGDFAGALRILGRDALDLMLDIYRQPVDAHLPGRALLAATGSAFGDIRYGVEGQRPEYVASGILALQRLFPE